ncbi:MAG: hypothetical protein EXX96DRAFT_546699 [Benjaminiella poitrasii]|nr:MAG: hypothetical protein EXX96DRAFT_546699 [Benjaminiella poitrasii]
MMPNSSQRQYKVMPINLEKAEFIISLPSTSNTKKTGGTFKSMMFLLREMEDQLEAREKKNKTFYQVVHAIEYKYKKTIIDNRQRMQDIQNELRYLASDSDALASRRASVKQELDILENDLNDMREYAEQRRNKKSKRERQYHQLYHVPLIAAQYKKKYVRARDKNSDAEEKVSEVRALVDACQGALTELARSFTENQTKSQRLVMQQQEIEVETKKTEEFVFELHEGCKFWQGFDQHQASTARKAVTQFIETIQRCTTKSGNHDLHRAMDPNQNYVKFLKLALFEYGEAEKYANQKWGQLQVDFECAKCHVPQSGWPKPDKVRTSDLLCDACYQEHRASMIWEKKIGGVKDRSQQLLSLPGSSMLSFSSSSTVSSESSSSSKKPGFKKMFQLLKSSGNKRNSSPFSHSSSASSFTSNISTKTVQYAFSN